ncbi:response regulator [Paenibacillus alba]|uniref:Response regulator n=1 Tax=Paenibacillus alba TaxID=1197127 RepID=A0ABU6GCK5_9BACL|nr:response regulator [Paenibacillus alba]MEC0231919.1 response regulator [Paenibacillus alba]
MKIIIVDDEAQIRRWFEILVQKTGLPVDLIASCSNGRDALEVCRTEEVDIVITDIKMPVMDGISFIRQLKEERPSIKCLILSSYSEFHYATEAIKAGASDYMLKAEITVEGITNALKKAELEIERELTRDREVYNLKNTIHVNQYALRSFYFGELLRGKSTSTQDFEEKMDTLRIPLHSKHLMVMAIRSDEQAIVKEQAKIRHPDLLDSAVINIIDETLLNEANSGCCFVFEKDYYVAIFNCGQRGEKSLREITLQYAHRIASYLQDLLHLSVSIGISLPSLEVASLGQQLEEASGVLNHKRFYGRKSISWYSDESNPNEIGVHAKRQNYLEMLSLQLDRNQFDSSLHLLRQVLEEVGIQMLWSEKEVRAFGMEAGFLLQRTLRRLKTSVGAVNYSWEAETPHIEIADLPTFEHVKQWLLSRASNDLEAAESLLHPYSETIRKVCEYVRTHYAEGVSLQQAADYVHLNRNYLSELFKKETGSSYNDYLTLVRINKVKELILEGETQIGLLSETVGYPDGSYLSKVFKKVTGMTPLEFKRKKM